MERLRARRIKIQQRLQRRKFKKEEIVLDDEFEEGDSNLLQVKPAIDSEFSKKFKPQTRDSVVTILLIKARNLPLGVHSRELNDAHIKFKLGSATYKSKSTWTERWLEQFNLHLFDGVQNLELTLWNRNILYGKSKIELSGLQRETTHGIWQTFDDCSGEVFLLLTISGTTALDTISDLRVYKEDAEEVKILHERYKWTRSLQNLRDIGHFKVKVYGAIGLVANDFLLKSNPVCVLELGNARLQTQTEHRTLMPNWNKIFTFNVKDITQCLEVTVYDESGDHGMEFLGKVVIPLLSIENGAKRWYTLKNKNLRTQAKGNNPQILLEMSVVFNEVRAVCRIFQPKEEKLIQEEIKFKRLIFLHNIRRFKRILKHFLDISHYLQSCFEWESPLRSTVAFVFWTLICWYGELEMIPLVLLCLVLRNCSLRSSVRSVDNYYDFDEKLDDIDDDEIEEELEARRSLKERLQRLQETTLTLQIVTGSFASLGERFKNIFNFSVPVLSWFAALLFLLAFVILHFVPMRFVLLAVGIIKFVRPILHPKRIPTNRLFYFLTRVPDDVELKQFSELQATPKK